MKGEREGRDRVKEEREREESDRYIQREIEIERERWEGKEGGVME